MQQRNFLSIIRSAETSHPGYNQGEGELCVSINGRSRFRKHQLDGRRQIHGVAELRRQELDSWKATVSWFTGFLYFVLYFDP
jgi:hypothetical protein